jgi:hypothetical protein
MTDFKISELSEVINPVEGDILPIVDDIEGTPTTKKISGGNLFKLQSKTYVTVGFSNADYIVDGTADNVQIQEAVDAVELAGGGTVFIRAGDYDIAATINITAEHGIALVGAGWGTTLRIANNANIYAITFIPSTATTPVWTMIRDLHIHCNGGNQTAGGGIYAQGAVESLFENIWFEEAYGEGLFLYEMSTGNIGHNNRIINCHFDRSSGVSGNGMGILMQGNDENQIIACDFQGLGGAGAEPYAIKDYSGLNSIVANTFVSGKHCIKLQNCMRTKIVGNTFDGGWHQIFASSNLCVFSSNSFFLTGDAGATATHSAIYIDWGGENIIANNTMESHLTNDLTRSFFRDAGDGNNTIIGNRFKERGTISHSFVEDGGTADNTYLANNGYNNEISGSFKLEAMASADASNGSLFVDTTDSIIKYKDTSGIVQDLIGGEGGSSSDTLQAVFNRGQAITIADTENRTLAVTNNDVTNNPETVTIANNSGGYGLRVNQNVPLAINQSALRVYSDAAQTNDATYLFRVDQDSASSNKDTMLLVNKGTGRAFEALQQGNAVAFLLTVDNTGGDAHNIQLRQPNGATGRFIEALTNWATMFTVNNDGAVFAAGRVTAGGGLTIGEAKVTISATEPTSPDTGDVWIHTA